eukprot:5156774-Pyramimonas_sp.AAC.1
MPLANCSATAAAPSRGVRGKRASFCDPPASKTFATAWLSSMNSAIKAEFMEDNQAIVPTAAMQAIALRVLPHPPRRSLPRECRERRRSDVSSCGSVGPE